MNKVIEIERTCFACPSQWEGKLDDGREIYIRYRNGNFSVLIDDETVMKKRLSISEEDQYLTDEEMIVATEDILDWTYHLQ